MGKANHRRLLDQLEPDLNHTTYQQQTQKKNSQALTHTSQFTMAAFEKAKAKAVQPTPWYLTTGTLLSLAILERVVIFFWGLYQDATIVPRFTDIDYFVFTDAARFMSLGGSPYDRETYRYTPLLAWLLTPTTQSGLFSFGKVIFAVGDIIAGYLVLRVLRMRGVSERTAVACSSVWLLNPMVSVISTRGSSEGLLGAMVVSFVWAVCQGWIITAGMLAGLAVHFKIYPIIYIPTVILWLLPVNSLFVNGKLQVRAIIKAAFSRQVLSFTITAALTFSLLTGFFYIKYGYPFLLHTYLHHLSRIDHRHNFSPYSTLLYMSYSPFTPTSSTPIIFDLSKLAFFPQLFLSGFLIPLLFAKLDLPKTLFLQTVAFVTFNKVCTAQYFMWYMVLLPFYLPSLISKVQSNGIRGKVIAGAAVALWVGAQAYWVSEGYLLEFMGESTFYPGLFLATMGFFLVNCGCLVLLIRSM